MLKLVWSATARDDIKAIIAYIAERNATAAIKLLAAVESCAESLPAHPFSYRVGRIDGTREAVVHPNYILIYEVRLDTVQIMNVIHSRRQYPPCEDI